MNYDGLMIRDDFLEYAEAKGKQAAADLLLLCGPDGYAGDYDEYCALMQDLAG